LTAPVLYEELGTIARVTLNRPDALNSFTAEVGSAVRAAFERVGAADHLRAAVFTGAGRGFSAGADLKQGFPSPEATLAQLEEHFAPAIETMLALPKPIVAAVEGFATGIGASFALASDIVLLGKSAFLQVPFARIGLVPDGGMCWQLAARLGPRVAFELAMSGERVPAERCVALGLANRVVPDGEVCTHAEAFARELASAAPLALAGTKRLLGQAAALGLAGTMSAEAKEQAKCIASSDFREGVRSFIEKRPPKFTGR
jgi:2-(1,2-epoxy-1,2-dihydrophenyl)acetyl-CoA isomerase